MIATTPDVQAKLREGGRRLALILQKTAAAVRPGINTDQLNTLCEGLVREGGDMPVLIGYTPHGAKRPYPATVCISVNEEVVHGIPNENPRTINEGDLVSLDCVMSHQGLYVDAAITLFAGKGDPEGQALMDATHEALMAGIAAARAGNRIGDISAAIEKVGVDKGYGIVYELGGHGVGKSVHEAPYIPNVGDAGTGELLFKGMVLAIEPMFTLGTPKVKLMPDGYTFVTRDGSRSAHFEHTILITSAEPEILTKAT